MRQLLDADTLRVLRSTDGQVEVRLYANNGRVRERPAVLLNAGPQALVGVGEVATTNGSR